MRQGRKNFHKIFASASLGFALFSAQALPRPLEAAAAAGGVKRNAASTQFSKAEDLRAALNDKTPDKRALAEYKQVVNSYRRVYMITPHAAQVPDALLAVGELNTEMGDRFGRSYYQAAVDAYEFLIREYPASRHVQEALLRVSKLQKDQLGDPAAATKSFQDFQRKFPRSPHRREVQEALAELALMRNAEHGDLSAKANAPAPAPAAAPAAEKLDAPIVAVHTAASGGESAQGGEIPRVQGIKTQVTADRTEIVIQLEDTVEYVSGRIMNPDRIYFDLHPALLTSAVARGNVQVSGDLLTKVRVAQNHAGVVRVVLDVSGVQDYAASLLKKPTRLVIELYGKKSAPTQTAKTNRAAKPEENAAVTQGATPSALEGGPRAPEGDSSTGDAVTHNPAPVKAKPDTTVASGVAPPPSSTSLKPIPAPSKSTLIKPNKNTRPDLVTPAPVAQPTRDGQSTLTRALGLKISRIVIDPGHGGHDTGTIGPTGMMEKDLCLDVALRLGKLIQQKLPGADIIYTRSDDTFIPLEERTHIANEAKADLFVSIHANSSPDHEARGVETYYLNLKGSPEAMEVAARENAASQENIHELEDLVKKIARTEKIDESKELAVDIQDSLSRRIQKTAKPVKNRGVRKAPFVVLIGADMPSILTEISFLSNPSDEQLLKKPEHRQRVAEGLFQGVAAYLQSLNSVAVNSPGRSSRPVVVPVEQSRNQK
jgi:N-acetylmuramoyl-L-alanine amidase